MAGLAQADRFHRDDDRGRHGPRQEALASWNEEGGPAPFRIWRGRSGKRYVVSIHQGHLLEWQGMEDAVVLAVRAEAGEHRLMAASQGLSSVAFAAWAMGMADGGATEFHVHWLAGSAAAREAMRGDLLF